MSRPTYVLGGSSYTSLALVEQRVKALLRTCGEITDPANVAFLRDLVVRHERADELTARPISHFVVTNRNNGPGNGLAVVTKTGERLDFGYRSCVVATPRHPLWKAIRAAREAVREDTDAAKFEGYAALNGICPVTGRWFDFNEAHVHHEPPNTFSVVFEAFATRTSVDLLAVVNDEGTGWRPRFASSFVEWTWIYHHRALATLRVVSVEGHKRLEALQRPAKVTPR